MNLIGNIRQYLNLIHIADLNVIPKNDKFRNHNQNEGMMDVTKLENSNKTNQMFIEAFEKNGFHESKDYNAEESLNRIVSMSQISTKDGKRWSTASGYLLNAVKQQNLDILIHSHVCRVEFDSQKQVTGECWIEGAY